jgi:hypothetical protein
MSTFVDMNCWAGVGLVGRAQRVTGFAHVPRGLISRSYQRAQRVSVRSSTAPS